MGRIRGKGRGKGGFGGDRFQFQFQFLVLLYLRDDMGCGVLFDQCMLFVILVCERQDNLNASCYKVMHSIWSLAACRAQVCLGQHLLSCLTIWDSLVFMSPLKICSNKILYIPQSGEMAKIGLHSNSDSSTMSIPNQQLYYTS